MKNMIKKLTKIFIPTVISLFFFSSIASAHVTVAPKTSSTGAWETYTLKVPVEKDVPTTKVTVKVPSGLEIESYQPVPGWNYTTEKDSSGKVITFTFEATGAGILPGQFQQFVFVAKNPNQATKAAWDAYQYYKDGSVVEWTGDETAKTPHSITDIVKAASTDQHNMQNMTKTTEKASKKDVTQSTSSLPTILSVVAVLLSLIALLMSFRKK
ncbi:YcnI family copper-binding membrane protein [Neobacillus ginsengisoli]|uniref:Uncharacterized protein YcnI n=1 Tax=Neobacillus ginsengisoli TaxID=904295 RepID=A0ABT9XS01_9BACI|nr:YcnI family protein [Neobacillus ginsengisoli]MDQ0198337.1 uncharacterized protein YcnI [Neobacillus ginsengisoli]